mmetsp:Transcript_19399/g.42153  ORF Transcript_19399/g.42153 Transcript_19399/m.42153 type:complete len:206 (+) Transcript_19399:3083-3700(+)
MPSILQSAPSCADPAFVPRGRWPPALLTRDPQIRRGCPFDRPSTMRSVPVSTRKCIVIAARIPVPSAASARTDAAAANAALILLCTRRQSRPRPIYSLLAPIDPCAPIPPAMRATAAVKYFERRIIPIVHRDWLRSICAASTHYHRPCRHHRHPPIHCPSPRSAPCSSICETRAPHPANDRLPPSRPGRSPPLILRFFPEGTPCP